MAYKKSNPNSQASSANSEPVVLSTEQEAKIDLLATKAKQDILNATVFTTGDALSDPSNQKGVLVMGVNGADEATPLSFGTGGVSTINNNGAGASAVNVQDGGNSITVDGTVSVTGVATETTLAALNTKVTAVNTGAVVVSSSALPTGAATAALQTQPGVDIGDVTINNTSGASAVNIQDGGNSITVDGTVTANISGSIANTSFIATQATAANLNMTEVNSAAIKTAVETIDNAIAGSEMQVDVVAPLPAGTNNIGDVDVLTLPALPAGTNNIGDVDVLSCALPTGAATETTLAAVNTKTPALGQAVMASSSPVVIASNQTAVPVSMSAASVLFKGRAATFRTPGRAGTAGQNIMAIHNATGSAVTVTVNKIVVDIYQTVVKAITVPPPNIRIWKVTVLPTNGTALAKTKIGGTTTSSASVTVFGDASADGTGSATTLTTTRPAGAFIAQKFASRFITAAGYEPADTIEYLDDSTVTLSALEGLVIFLDYTVATMNPVTDMWTAVVEWSES